MFSSDGKHFEYKTSFRIELFGERFLVLSYPDENDWEVMTNIQIPRNQCAVCKAFFRKDSFFPIINEKHTKWGFYSFSGCNCKFPKNSTTFRVSYFIQEMKKEETRMFKPCLRVVKNNELVFKAIEKKRSLKQRLKEKLISFLSEG